MSFVRISQAGARENWTIVRPERLNALGTSIAAELGAAVATLKRRAETGGLPRVLVLSAEPVVKGATRHWIAGGDLRELAALDDAAAAGRYAATLTDCLETLNRLPLLVIVAVDGAAIGGGAELALGGDVRIATEAASLVFKQLRVGLATGYGGARRLVDAVGLARAQGLLFLGETLSAAEAQRLGLWHRVVAEAQTLVETVDSIAREAETLGAAAIGTQKLMFQLATRAHPGAAQAGEHELFAKLWRNPEHAAFLERFAAVKGGT